MAGERGANGRIRYRMQPVRPLGPQPPPSQQARGAESRAGQEAWLAAARKPIVEFTARKNTGGRGGRGGPPPLTRPPPAVPANWEDTAPTARRGTPGAPRCCWPDAGGSRAPPAGLLLLPSPPRSARRLAACWFTARTTSHATASSACLSVTHPSFRWMYTPWGRGEAGALAHKECMPPTLAPPPPRTHLLRVARGVHPVGVFTVQRSPRAQHKQLVQAGGHSDAAAKSLEHPVLAVRVGRAAQHHAHRRPEVQPAVALCGSGSSGGCIGHSASTERRAASKNPHLAQSPRRRAHRNLHRRHRQLPRGQQLLGAKGARDGLAPRAQRVVVCRARR